MAPQQRKTTLRLSATEHHAAAALILADAANGIEGIGIFQATGVFVIAGPWQLSRIELPACAVADLRVDKRTGEQRWQAIPRIIQVLLKLTIRVNGIFAPPGKFKQPCPVAIATWIILRGETVPDPL